MIAVKVTCKSGDSWITEINTTLEGAQRYFKGYLNVTENFETGEETFDPVVSCELAKEKL
jgi:hypothetical protein